MSCSRRRKRRKCSVRSLRYLNAMTVLASSGWPRSPAIPPVLWYVVVIGAFLTIAFLGCLRMDLMPQIMLGGITAFFLGIMIFLIYAMDHPLQGAISVPPELVPIGL